MAIYKKITTATTTDLISKGGQQGGSINSVLISNFIDANAVTISLFLEDAAVSESTNASNNKYFYIANLVMPIGTSIKFDDVEFFDSKKLNLRITTAGTSPLVSVII